MDTLKMSERLYKALATSDAATLVELWSEDFRADLTPGLPFGLGAEPFTGRDRMFAYFGEIGAHFTVAPEVDEIAVAESATATYIVGRGNYVGMAISTGADVRARFLHLWEVRGGQIVSVFQSTDTAAWHDALS